jgi:hypothetical protein
MVRTRLRRPRQVRRSKTRSRTRKPSIPPELHAPITGEIERQLKQLVAQFGEKKVFEALDPLVTKCKWNDWQCVANAIRRIARQKSGNSLPTRSAARAR